MADEKISAMASATTLDGTELVPLVQGGSNVKGTANNLLKQASPTLDAVSGDLTISASGGGNLIIDTPELSFNQATFVGQPAWEFVEKTVADIYAVNQVISGDITSAGLFAYTFQYNYTQTILDNAISNISTNAQNAAATSFSQITTQSSAHDGSSANSFLDLSSYNSTGSVELKIISDPTLSENLINAVSGNLQISASGGGTITIDTVDLITTNGSLGVPKHALVAGGAAGDITVTGIKVGDRIDEVIEYVYATAVTTDILDLTSEFTITGANTINNTGGSDTSGNKLMVRWTKLTV